ncbi:phosphoribosylglycinamide formyltransferase [Candidatus Woesearchaeota archaeon]|nr:phosphoribosylglycinamide formyltransferase [Candidatus Woesearchaeota archaeon]
MNKIAVLASGSGTNFEAIAKACKEGSINAEVAVVVSNNENAGVFERLEKYNIDGVVIPHDDYCKKNFPNITLRQRRLLHEDELITAIKGYEPDLIVLAGYMRILTSYFLNEFKNKVVNIHPADTRMYQGAHGYEWAWENRESLESTCATVHFVDSGVDTGPIILQAPIAVKSEYKDIDDLKKTGLKIEHELYPLALKMYFEGLIKLEGKEVVIKNEFGRFADGGLSFVDEIDDKRANYNIVAVDGYVNVFAGVVRIFGDDFYEGTHEFIQFTSLMKQVNEVRQKGYRCELNFEGLRF